MFIFCRIGIGSGIFLWQFIWNTPISSIHILTIAFKLCDAATGSKEIHGDDDVDGSIDLLLRSCWRNVSLLVAPFFDNQQILVESLISERVFSSYNILLLENLIFGSIILFNLLVHNNKNSRDLS